MLFAALFLPMSSCSSMPEREVTPAKMIYQVSGMNQIADPGWRLLTAPFFAIVFFPSYWTGLPVLVAGVTYHFFPFQMRSAYRKAVILLAVVFGLVALASAFHPIQYIKVALVGLVFFIAFLHEDRVREAWNDEVPRPFSLPRSIKWLRSGCYAHAFLCSLAALHLASYGATLLYGGVIASLLNVAMAISLILIGRQCEVESAAYPAFQLKDLLLAPLLFALLLGTHALMRDHGGQIEKRMREQAGELYGLDFDFQ